MQLCFKCHIYMYIYRGSLQCSGGRTSSVVRSKYTVKRYMSEGVHLSQHKCSIFFLLCLATFRPLSRLLNKFLHSFFEIFSQLCSQILHLCQNAILTLADGAHVGQVVVLLKGQSFSVGELNVIILTLSLCICCCSGTLPHELTYSPGCVCMWRGRGSGHERERGKERERPC